MAVNRDQTLGENLEFVSRLELVPDAILGDYDSIRLVISNLVRNAIRFTPDGGRIEVTSRHYPEGEYAQVMAIFLPRRASNEPNVFCRCSRSAIDSDSWFPMRTMCRTVA